MNRIPVDVDAFMAGVVQPVGFTPVVNYETGEQRSTKAGLPQWRLTVIYQQPPTPDRPMPGEMELVKIKFNAHQQDLPEPKTGARLVLGGLAVSHWEITGDNGNIVKSGATISAETVDFQAPARPAKAA